MKAKRESHFIELNIFEFQMISADSRVSSDGAVNDRQFLFSAENRFKLQVVT